MSMNQVSLLVILAISLGSALFTHLWVMLTLGICHLVGISSLLGTRQGHAKTKLNGRYTVVFAAYWGQYNAFLYRRKLP